MIDKLTKILVLLLAAVTLYFNIPFTLRWAQETRQWYQRILASDMERFTKPGREYTDLRPYLKNIETAGYISDYHLTTAQSSIGRFMAAQYTLAPVALQADDIDQMYIVLDFQSKEKALLKMKELNLQAVYMNPHHKILARKM